MSKAGVIVIGRNEGERLVRCLKSVASADRIVVYVDSGSTDGSVAAAEAMGVVVQTLDRSAPFTAARARNAGFAKLMQMDPQTEFVQFVDGDCEIDPHWLALAQTTLSEQRDVAIVCGRRRERFPERSIYNRLCDLEWNTPVGETTECGGDAMISARSLAEVEGYRPDLIAGEEPELCVRLRARGWKIKRLDCEMTLHDAAITPFFTMVEAERS